MLQSRHGAGGYINAFWAPFQGLSLSDEEVYILGACSLLAIPPPAGRVAPQGGFPTDLLQINLSDWASLVQDVAAGLQALPPGLSNCLDPEVLNLLHHLEAVTQVKFCHLCYHLETNCRCPGVPLLAPPTSWSQIVEQTLGYGRTASSSGVTTPSTSLGGMSRLVPHPPGISIWDLFQWKAPISQKPVTTPPYRPPAGRAKRLKAALSMRGWCHRSLRLLHPSVSHLYSPGVDQQPCNQQTVQPPTRTSGLGVTFDSSASKPAPTDSWDTDVHGRQATQG